MTDISNETAKRKTRTPEERKAALLAELAEIEAKQRVKDKARHAKLNEEIEKLDGRINTLVLKRRELQTELASINERAQHEQDD